MKTINFFVFILCIGLSSSTLFAQSQADFAAKMDPMVGEWLLDKESIIMEPASDQPIPDLKMTLSKDGDKYNRTVHFKTPEGNWVQQASEVYEYDANSKMLKYTGETINQEKYRGQFLLMENGNIHSIEFNENNQKTSELVLELASTGDMKASIKNFIYPETADEDMTIVNVQTTWKKQ